MFFFWDLIFYISVFHRSPTITSHDHLGQAFTQVPQSSHHTGGGQSIEASLGHGALLRGHLLPLGR
jgi:hypothetical protein